MATLIELETMGEYPALPWHVYDEGLKSRPRGRDTYDAGHTTIVLHDPRQNLAVGTGRGLSPRVAAVEAVQLVAGFHDPELMVWSSPNFERFRSGPDTSFYGAYGDRIGDQLRLVTEKLREDRFTRRAVITLWDPARDNVSGELDYPCTVALGFTVRRPDYLDMNVLMRSNDVWLGLPYDVFQFTQLQLTLARRLELEVGRYTHTAWSLHLYITDIPKLDQLREPGSLTTFQPDGFTHGAPEGLVYSDVLDRDATETEKWYHAQFAGYRQRRAHARQAELGRHVAGGG